MSSSKEHLAVPSPGPPRVPKCTRCRHHGTVVPLKGHSGSCPFRACGCWKCGLVTQRTRITAVQRRMKIAPDDPRDRERRPDARAAATRATPAPREDAPLSATFRMQCPAAPGGCPPGAERSSHSGQVVPFASREFAPRISAPFLGEFGPAAPLPVLHVPWMSGYPGDYVPRPNILLNVPGFHPVPAGLYSYGPRGPPAFLHYPPPPRPGAAAVILCARQPPREPPPPPPPSEHTEPDVEVD
uniref:doublesex- and mab-3-related transcription factor B1-like n=1 Tax=Gasterosteus aculeatus aculeatus TaxID=481459 RepID=UPI001A9950EA|nr:doublesex- and mab-3-related transcription factor B1-like [Gasterosteus aculeatus aculeatus]